MRSPLSSAFRPFVAVSVVALAAPAAPAAAQEGWTAGDPVLQRIWTEGMENSRLRPLAQALLDSIGPRLTGTPEKARGHRWLEARYAEWGIAARTERYGTWPGWRRGPTHVDLVAPRRRTLEASMLAWSPGTPGPVEGAVVTLPDVAGRAEFLAWLPTARGRFVLLSPPPITCRPTENWDRWATPATMRRLPREAAAVGHRWDLRLQRAAPSGRRLVADLEEAGAAGVLLNEWTGGWGTERVHAAPTPRIPAIGVGCEDYTLLARLAEGGQGPRLRVSAESEDLGPVPAANTLAEIRGGELPEEYVILSAHFDSWDGASGATDNGTGTVVMMEAMRLLRIAYPRPRRTILAGHWGGEEQGLNGSRAFAEDHPAVVAGLHVLLNQDTGTGRVDNVSLQGFARAAPYVRRWLAAMPPPLASGVALDDPGFPSAGSSDHASFVCRGVPAFWLLSTSWDYGTYTWHTNRDTYDKLSFDDLRANAVLVAMLAYLAAEEPERLPRGRRAMPPDPATGKPVPWPHCPPAVRGLD